MDPSFTQYLSEALASKFGIVIATDNLPVLRARLYKARAEASDPDLDRLQFRPDPVNPETYLWIIKGEDPHATAQGPAEGAQAHSS